MHLLTLTFALHEDEPPDHFANRVARACAVEGALHEGEGVVLPSDPTQAWTSVEPHRMEKSQGEPGYVVELLDNMDSMIALRRIALPGDAP